MERYDPWRHCARLDVRVVHRDLPGALRAFWHSPSRTIVLDRGLSQRERRCSLAHELVHVERRDECRQPPKVEALVHLEAARRLIALDHLAASLRWTHDRQVLADELWVDDVTLDARLDGLTVVERDWLASRVASVA